MQWAFLLDHAGRAEKLTEIKQIEAVARGFNGLLDVDVGQNKIRVAMGRRDAKWNVDMSGFGKHNNRIQRDLFIVLELCFANSPIKQSCAVIPRSLNGIQVGKGACFELPMVNRIFEYMYRC